jgi:hypothetical protein
MRNNKLVYIPNGLNSPEFEILLSQTQELIKKNDKITILTCRGGKNYSCSKNIFSIKSICYSCKHLRKKGFSLLKGKFNIQFTPEIKKKFSFSRKINFLNTFDYKYRGVDNGLSAYSSYVGITRDRDLEGCISNNTIRTLINCSNNLTDFFYKILSTKEYDEVYMFNGRMNESRPLLRVAKKLNINTNNLEMNATRDRVFNNKSNLPIDHISIGKKMNLFWKNYKKNYDKIINKYFLYWKNNQNIFHKSFIKKRQTQNLLPKNWNNKKKNIVFFASSDDENLTGGRNYFFKLFKNQYDCIYSIFHLIKKKDNFNTIDFWLRLHPRMKGLSWSHLKKIHSLKREGLNFIEANSKISSFAMIEKSDLVISPVSSLSVDAAFMHKPVINFINHPFSYLGKNIIPRDINQLKNILFKNKKTNNYLAAKKMYFYYLTAGFSFKNLTGSLVNGYSFNNSKILMTPFLKLCYLFGKSIEKYYYNFLLNFIFFKLNQLRKNNKI